MEKDKLRKKFKHLSSEDWETIRKLIILKQQTVSETADLFEIDRHSIYAKGWRDGWLLKKKDKGIVNKIKKFFE